MNGERIVREGYPFIITAFVLTILVGYFFSWQMSIIPFVLTCFFMFFFRSPHRQIPADENIIVSPADGKVMDVSEVIEDLFLNEKCKKVTIFLSVFNVHVNRSPMSGNIKFRQYTCGGFRPAFEKTVGFENERHTVGIVNDKLSIVVTQIAGLLARRIVSWVKLGDDLQKGQLYGMIKFGSCTEIFMPNSIAVTVKKGDKVVGGETVIGRISNEKNMDT